MMIYPKNHIIGLPLMWIVTTLIIPSEEASYELSFPFYRSDKFADTLEEEHSAKRRRCKNDSECNISKCEYCASEGYCIEYLDDWCEVSSNMCGNGDGDCDPYDNKEECKSGHICGHNNLLKIHPNLANLPPNCDTKNDEKVEKADACVKEDGGLENYMEECREKCNMRSGLCDWCGKGSCCKKDIVERGCGGIFGGRLQYECTLNVSSPHFKALDPTVSKVSSTEEGETATKQSSTEETDTVTKQTSTEETKNTTATTDTSSTDETTTTEKDEPTDETATTATTTTKPDTQSTSEMKVVGEPLFTAKVKLVEANSSKISGELLIKQMDDELVTIQGDILNLPPGKHAFHVHTHGLTGNDCKDAGGHFNPTNMPHGRPKDTNRHVGDLGNILSKIDGGITPIFIEDKVIKLDPGHANSILNRSIVIHRDPDDFTGATGNAGPRIACGVIRKVNGDVTFNDGECKARNLEIDHGYGMALVKQCMTSDSAKHWAGGCNVTYECLQGYDITGPTEFICKDGIWINKNGTRDENLPECVESGTGSLNWQEKLAFLLGMLPNLFMILIFRLPVMTTL